ncbi:MAG: gliding motility-associated C-terminal domain-containing protein [Bacteroidetes bacterium]|nr:gliding motility-associated C-terminal domain-containing protein [Bacteroidota bacterium]
MFMLFLFLQVSAFSQYCAPQYAASCQGPSPYTADFINNFSTSGGITNITNNNSGCNFQTNNFIYYSNQTVTATQGCSFNVSMQCGPEFQQGFAIWVDWNADNDYSDAGELVYSSPSAGYQTFTGTVQVPATATPGIKRMRVRCSFATVPSNPCTLQGGFTAYGEVEEYNVEVVSGDAGAVQVSDQTICAGTSTQITATAQGIIRWYLNQTSTTQIALGPTFTTPVLNQTTTYWVQATFGPCTTPRVPVTITVIPPFTVTVSASQNPVCAGTPFTLTATAAGSGLTYNWSPANDIISTLQNTATASIPANTAFTVTATDASGCIGTGTLIVNANQAPQITVTATPSTICEGQQTALTTSGGGPNYSWTPATGLSSTSGAAVGASPAVTTTYTVTSPGASGTCPASGSVTVTVNPAPTVNAGSDVSVCNGVAANLSASGAASYSWSPAAGMSAPNSANTSVTPSATSTYTVTGVSAAGCSATDNVTVTVHALPVANPGNNAANCSGTGAQLNGSGGAGYQWSPATGLSSTTIANPVATPATTTNYTLVVTDANGCVSAPSAPVTVTVFQQPAAPAISASGPVSFCQGGTVTLSAPAASSYLWSTGATTQNLIVNQSGNYTVQITDANGCTSPLSAPFPVTVHALPAAPVINADGPLTFCDGGSVNLTATGSGTFSWNTGASTTSIPVNSSGSFTVTLTDANGCQATSSAVNVTEQAPLSAPQITPVGSLSFCPGGSVTLTAPAAASYQWSNGASTQSINVTQTGAYTVIITDAAGCVSPVSATIGTTLNPSPATPAISAIGNYPACTGQTAQLTGPAAALYNWSTGATSQTINVSVPGQVTLTITDVNGCVSAASAPFQVSFFPLPPAPAISAVGPSTFCEGETVTLQAMGTGTINWNNSMNGAQIEVGNSGQYTATVTDNNGCTSNNSAPIQVYVIPAPDNASITVTGQTAFCEGDSVLLTSNPAPQYSWSTGATTQSIWVHNTDTYVVTIGGTTCPPDISTASKDILVHPTPVPVITASTNRDCLPVEISFDFTTNGIGPFSYLWRLSNGTTSTEANPVFEFDRAGLYDVTLTLTDVIGCTAQLSEKDFIEILPRAIPALTIYPRVTTDNEPTIMLVSQTFNADSVHWNLGPLGEYVGDTLFITLPDTGVFPLEYTVSTEAGCEVILKDEMRMVEDFTVYIPNGFSPNDDEKNDVFIPVTRGMDAEYYQFAVFNRWGQEIFSTSDPLKGWDGKDAQIDTYIYKVQARGVLGEDKEFTGSVTLIR